MHTKVFESTPIKIETGTLEVLKWFALVLMLGDHINTALFNRQLPVIFEAARVVFPIFAVIFAYNLQRPGIDSTVVVTRLLIFAVISQPFHAYTFGHWLPLNVLFTLAAGAGCMLALDTKQYVLAVALFFGAGLFVDYSFPGIALVMSASLFFRVPNAGTALGLVLCVAGLAWINGNYWALASLPLILLAMQFRWNIKRHPRAFYILYPAHLALLAALVTYATAR